MDTGRLRLFLACAEEGSFSAAARRLFISHSTVSRQMAALEGELGVKLFERRAESVGLTGAGRLLAARAPKLLEDIDKLRSEIEKEGTRYD